MNTTSAAIWLVNALVEATPISGPACRKIPPSTSRAMVLPTTLTIPSVCAPRRFASRSAASVSAVSPDCEMTMTSVCSSTSGLR